MFPPSEFEMQTQGPDSGDDANDSKDERFVDVNNKDSVPTAKTDHPSNHSNLDTEASEKNSSASVEKVTTAANLITIAPSPSVVQLSTEHKSGTKVPKKPEASMDSLAMLSETKSATSRETSLTQMDTPATNGIQKSMDAENATEITQNPSEKAPPEPEPTESSDPAEEDETVTSKDTEPAKSFVPIINPPTKTLVQTGFENTLASNDSDSIQSKNSAKSFVPNFGARTKSPVQMEEEETVASNDTESVQSKNTTKAFEAKILPTTGTAVETASQIAAMHMQANVAPKFEGKIGDSTMISSKKKRRKSNNSMRRKEAFASPRPTATTEAFDVFFTPKKDNTGFKGIFEPKKRNSESSSSFSPRLGACKTASSFEEVCADRTGMIMTQPSFGATDNGDNNLEEMKRSAELDFEYNTLYSPLTGKATKKLKLDQPTYGSYQSPDPEPEKHLNNYDYLCTQQEEEGSYINSTSTYDEWFDSDLTK